MPKPAFKNLKNSEQLQFLRSIIHHCLDKKYPIEYSFRVEIHLEGKNGKD